MYKRQSQHLTYEDNEVFFQYVVENDDIKFLLDKLRPTVVISAFKGDHDAQLNAHKALRSYIAEVRSRKLLFISSSNVFEGRWQFPAYEYDIPMAESQHGKSKLAIEKELQQLPEDQLSILRLPIVLGVNAPVLVQLKQAVKHQAVFEVFPNRIISVTTQTKLAQQVHYIINQKLSGIFHLASVDVVHHIDLFVDITEKLEMEIPIFKKVYESNEERYLALLAKDNLLPKTYTITVAEVIEECTLKEEISTLKKIS